jgi:Xaa-Pro aminopeptidase
MRFGQPHPETHPHLLKPGEVTAGVPKEEYRRRREEFMSKLPQHSVALIPAHPESFMSFDIPYRFRQHTDFLYLTGYQEPDALALLSKTSNTAPIKFTMFVRPRDPNREMWDGPRTGVEGALSFIGADEAYPLSSLEERLESYLRGKNHIFLDHTIHPKTTDTIARSLKKSIKVQSPKGILQMQRLIKSATEISCMQRSTFISGQAFADTIAYTRPGILESELEAYFEYQVRRRGAQRVAYPPVFASGIHANTLHYIANDDVMRDGQLLLVDAGGECDGFSSDISRTWPVNGRFSPAQLEVYEVLLEIQIKCIDKCRADGKMTMSNLHNYSTTLMKQGLSRLGLLKTKTADVDRFYPHSIGHWVGMDVHDVHDISLSLPLQPGMMCTVEPGIYIPDDPDVPPRFRGMGMRIEDDILVTDGAPEVLTREAPKDPKHIEQLMAQGPPPLHTT